MHSVDPCRTSYQLICQKRLFLCYHTVLWFRQLLQDIRALRLIPELGSCPRPPGVHRTLVKSLTDLGTGAIITILARTSVLARRHVVRQGQVRGRRARTSDTRYHATSAALTQHTRLHLSSGVAMRGAALSSWCCKRVAGCSHHVCGATDLWQFRMRKPGTARSWRRPIASPIVTMGERRRPWCGSLISLALHPPPRRCL
jgi:hypothetical protein